jgi:hypothetical protein
MPALLTNATSTGAAVQWDGGIGAFSAAGTFSGATVTLQWLGPDGATYLDVGSDTTLTAAGAGAFVLPPCRIRAAVSGGPPSGMYAAADKVR